MPKFIAALIGKFLARKMKLKETPMDDKKKWYQSKGVWAGVVTVLVGTYASAATQFGLPAIPDWIFTLLGAAGLYSRVVAKTEIKA